jgi:hypothetical protein
VEKQIAARSVVRDKRKTMSDPLRDHLLKLLQGSEAHVDLDTAIKGLPAELRGKRPSVRIARTGTSGLHALAAPHSPWEILEHMRVAQWDILDFSRNANYKAMKWPDEYWPKTPAPPSANAWTKSVRAFREDMESMCALVGDPKIDLFARIPHGDGQTMLREALLLADHNAYHLGELVLVRRLLGAWK